MNTSLVPNLIRGVIWILILTVLYGVVPLVWKEFSQGDLCPKIGGVPACYIIFACVLLMFISQLKVLNDTYKLYFTGAGIASSIAAVGSLMNIMGKTKCPTTENGTPMCYLSLLLFSSLLLLQLVQNKHNRLQV